MISPSSSRTMRRTPCVEGCDGPMFRTILSPWTSCSSSLTDGGSRSVLAAWAARAAGSRNWISWVAMEIIFGPCLNPSADGQPDTNVPKSYGLLFDRPRAVSSAVGLFDIVSSLEARIGFERVGLRNAHPGLASDGVVASCDRHERPAFERRGLREGHVRNFTRLSRERKILTQRKIRIAVPHQDTPHVGVTSKANAHHVVDFALV